jgi:hypothetical protein
MIQFALVSHARTMPMRYLLLLYVGGSLDRRLPSCAAVRLFVRRVIGAAVLDRRVYEEVEADRRAIGQAIAVVLLASMAGGIGMLGLGIPSPQAVVASVIGALAGWIAWAMLTYLIGTHLLPEPQTRADAGELLRTIAFASAPGLARVFGVIPVVGLTVYALASIWMLLAMIVAVRQALDYRSTGRAVAVCAVGWALSLAVAAIIGIVFAPTVS